MKQFCRDELFRLNKKHGRPWKRLKIQVQQNSWFRGKGNGRQNYGQATADRLLSIPILRPIYRTGAWPFLSGNRGYGWHGEIHFKNEVVAVTKNNRWVFSKHVSVLEKANYWAYPRSCIRPWRSYGPTNY